MCIVALFVMLLCAVVHRVEGSRVLGNDGWLSGADETMEESLTSGSRSLKGDDDDGSGYWGWHGWKGWSWGCWWGDDDC